MNEPSRYRQGEAQTLQGALASLELRGYAGQFGARAGGIIRCFSCRQAFTPEEAETERIRRLEGASDPADMLAVLPLLCPRCGTGGTLVLGYGPEAAIEDSEVLAALPDPEKADG
jgi:hypothetical protein